MQLSLETGQRLQRERQDLAEKHDAVAIHCIREYAKKHSIVYGHVTTDDLRTWGVAHGLYLSRNAWGAVLRGKGWTVIGRQPSKLPGNHHRSISVWRWDGDCKTA